MDYSIETDYAVLEIAKDLSPPTEDIKTYIEELSNNPAKEAFYGAMMEEAKNEYEILLIQFKKWYADKFKEKRRELEDEAQNRAIDLAKKSKEIGIKITGIKPREVTDKAVDLAIQTLDKYTEWQEKLRKAKRDYQLLTVAYKAYNSRLQALINGGSLIKKEMEALNFVK